MLYLFIALALVLALGWLTRRESGAAPIPTDAAANPLITPLGETRIIAHRAGAGLAPENTLLAFQRCAAHREYGVSALEFDLRASADGVPLVLHDPVLDRTSDARAHFGVSHVRARDRSYAALRELNMGEMYQDGAGNRPYAGLRGGDIPDALRILSLDQALQELKKGDWQGCPMDIKDRGALGRRSADRVYELLKRHDYLDRAVVGSFHPGITRYLRRFPGLRRNAGPLEVLRLYLCAFLGVRRARFTFVTLDIPVKDYWLNLGTTRFLNYAHAHHIAVRYWTVNDPAVLRSLRDKGADAVMTDLPDLARRIYRTS